MFEFLKNKKGSSLQRTKQHMQFDRLQYELRWEEIEPHTGIVFTKDNSMLAVFEFRGLDTASSTQEELIAYNSSLNNVFKSLPSGVAMWFEANRHYSSSYDKSEMPSPMLQKIEDDRAKYYNGQTHFDTSYFFTVCYQPASQVVNRLNDLFVEDNRTIKADADPATRALMDEVKKFIDILNLIYGMLEPIFPQLQQLKTEETLAYLHSTISNQEMKTIKFNPNMFLCDYLVDESLTGGREPMLGDKHMRIITLLNFPPVSYPGIFAPLDGLNMEYRWVSRFICKNKLDAQKEIKSTKDRQMQRSKSLSQYILSALGKGYDNASLDEEALAKASESSQALYELGQDNVSFGHYTMTIIVKDDSRQGVQKKADLLLNTIQSLGFTAHLETDNSLPAWFGSIPGNIFINLRQPLVSSLNFCHLAPTIAMWSGDKRNDYLNGAVLLYTDTVGSTPFRLNLHVGDLGHTMVVGPSGSGKSVLLNTIEAHFLKYPNSNVYIFDKSMSSRAMTMAVKGNFYNLAAEGNEELSFQPLANIDDNIEIKWAKEWIEGYLKTRNMEITPALDNAIWQGLQSLARLSEHQRTLSQLTKLVQDKNFRLAMKPMIKDDSNGKLEYGSYSKLFDNNKDFSGNGNWQVFEMETLMNTPAIVPTTLDYLFHRIETKLKRAIGPSIIVLDECWLFFDNPIFKDKLREYFKDMRKKNCSIIFATQNLDDIANKPELLSTIMENCPSRIYLPNVNAINEQNRVRYKIFGCNDRQIEIISSITAKRDYYYSSTKGNRVFSLALQPMELAFVTATSKMDQQKIDDIINTGKKDDFIHEWLIYKELPHVWEDFNYHYLHRGSKNE